MTCNLGVVSSNLTGGYSNYSYHLRVLFSGISIAPLDDFWYRPSLGIGVRGAGSIDLRVDKKFELEVPSISYAIAPCSQKYRR